MCEHENIDEGPRIWLARARGNLALAKTTMATGIFWEDLCFNAQQAAEKAFKAVFLHKGIRFRFIHDLHELITELQRNGVEVPKKLYGAAGLTEYAVETRYPGGREPVTEEEYHEAVQTAECVLLWAESIIGS
ncbi:MAG: HEPN domain-containing protein [Sedimentisphaerales bacterium]|nr:HEPN domain-containing protein [Sedimentisphaerales bacterium]